MTNYINIFCLNIRYGKEYSGPSAPELQNFLHESGWPQVKLVVIKTSLPKSANAYASGIVFKKIILTDYLIEQLSLAEIKAILAHELGHFQKHHLLKGFIILLVFLILPFVSDNSIPGIVHINAILRMVIYLLIIVIAASFFSRREEYDADSYLKELHISGQTYINAQLNRTPLSWHYSGYPMQIDRCNRFLSADKDKIDKYKFFIKYSVNMIKKRARFLNNHGFIYMSYEENRMEYQSKTMRVYIVFNDYNNESDIKLKFVAGSKTKEFSVYALLKADEDVKISDYCLTKKDKLIHVLGLLNYFEEHFDRLTDFIWCESREMSNKK